MKPVLPNHQSSIGIGLAPNKLMSRSDNLIYLTITLNKAPISNMITSIRFNQAVFGVQGRGFLRSALTRTMSFRMMAMMAMMATFGGFPAVVMN